MARFVAFLRGMNLGGRRITNEDLCAAFTRLGFEGASAFLASGNVVFDAADKAEAVAQRVEGGLAEELGYPVPTFLRSAEEVLAVAAVQPFAERSGHDQRGKLQVIFLQQAPGTSAAEAALALDSEEDWLTIEGRELFWLPSGGVSTSELDWKVLEKSVGPTTTRTKNTVQRLSKKFLS
ncbi:MAG: DUF1697 domain-containing protein [Acidobacteriota bacterium]|nr:DUF1697 domain-containing protein [Acidobacteriota bacterium]